MLTAMQTGYPDMSSQPLWGARNLLNLALLLAVPVPSALFSAWLFGVCEPHLLSRYVSHGMRTYAETNLSIEGGSFIPIVQVVEDVEYLRRIGSPFA